MTALGFSGTRMCTQQAQLIQEHNLIYFIRACWRRFMLQNFLDNPNTIRGAVATSLSQLLRDRILHPCKPPEGSRAFGSRTPVSRFAEKKRGVSRPLLVGKRGCPVLSAQATQRFLPLCELSEHRVSSFGIEPICLEPAVFKLCHHVR